MAVFPAEFSLVKLLAALGLANADTGRLSPGVAPVTAKTADYTVSLFTDKPGTVFSNYGASGTVIFTLPTPAAGQLGWVYDFYSVVGQTITITAATADTFVAFNDLAADSLSASTAGGLIGSHLRATCLQTGASTYAWLVETMSNGTTGTVAT